MYSVSQVNYLVQFSILTAYKTKRRATTLLDLILLFEQAQVEVSKSDIVACAFQLTGEGKVALSTLKDGSVGFLPVGVNPITSEDEENGGEG